MRRLLIVGLVGVVAVVLVALGAGYWFFSGDGLRLALEQQATAWLGQPVRIGDARAQVFPRAGVRLREVTVGDPVRLALADVQLSTALRALLGRRIEDARVVIADSRIEMPLPFAIPTGDSASADEDAPPGAVEIVSVREISLRDIRIVSRGREVVVSADSSLDGDRLTLRTFTAESGTTSLALEGEVDLAPRVDARLQATADTLDLDELLALANAFTPEQQPGATPRRSTRGATTEAAVAATMAVHLTADTATAGSIEVTQLVTDMSVDGDRVALSPLAFHLFGGRYEGAINATLGENLAVRLQSRLADLDVAQLAAFGGSPDTITGTLGGEGTFTAQGADMAAALASAAGTGTMAILDGSIRRLDLVRTVVLFLGRPAPETAAASDRFDRIDATLSLARQVFRADTFALRSRDADVTGSGTLTLGTKALAGALDLTLSEELSAQAGTDLARYTREGDRIVLPARIAGTLDEPRITIDAAAAIKRGLRNEVQRRLEGLFGR